MEFKEIDKLIEKYFSGESSLAEEQLIREFLLKNENLPEKYARLKKLFLYHVSSANEKSNLSITQITKSKTKTGKIKKMIIYGLAASIVLWISLTIFTANKQEKEIYAYINGKPIEDKDLAFKEAQKALLLVSDNLNAGTENLEKLNEINKVEDILGNK